MSRAVIAAVARTPIGRARKGSLVSARPDDLCAFAVKRRSNRPALDPAEIDDVIVGCGFPEGEQGMNLGRRVALLAELPPSVPGTTVNRFCASSLQAVRMACHGIAAGEGDAFVAAGVESISRVDGYPKKESELHPRLAGPGAIADAYSSMGMTAENVGELYGVPRSEMDRFAQRSQERAVAAQRSGFWRHEISSYELPDRKVVDHDDGPRPDSTLESLEALEPTFKQGGAVTAGNSCPLNDGAAAVLVLSEPKARSGARSARSRRRPTPPRRSPP